VIGGAPAAAVVFAGEVAREAAGDQRIKALDGALSQAEGAERQALRARRAELWETVLAEKRREFAERFDRVHSIERAVQMGSVSAVIDPASLRSSLIASVRRGIERAAGAVASNGAQGARDAINRPVVVDEHAAVVGAQQPPSGDGP
jgi:hypothetical protein